MYIHHIVITYKYIIYTTANAAAGIYHQHHAQHVWPRSMHATLQQLGYHYKFNLLHVRGNFTPCSEILADMHVLASWLLSTALCRNYNLPETTTSVLAAIMR